MPQILYQDEGLLAINKPNGLLVHPTKMAKYADTDVLNELRHIKDRPYYTIHRLDRKTSGVLLIALTKEMQSQMSKLFMEQQIDKKYKAIVRGYVDPIGEINYAIKNDKGVSKEAQTSYRLIRHFEIPYKSWIHETSRYSEVELTPKTGRYHQLRMHMAHIFHPIIGDRAHGCNKQNKFFKEKFGMTNMLLHAESIRFNHPILNKDITISAPFPDEYKRVLQIFNTKEKK